MMHALRITLAAAAVALGTSSAPAQTTTRVSVATGGGQGNFESTHPSISDDGRFVAFTSLASNLVAGDTNGTYDVFVQDRQTGQTTRVSVASGGAQGFGQSYGPSISADGRFVAFTSSASNLVAGDTNGTYDVFVHDWQTGQATRVSVATGGGQGYGDSYEPSISADGRFVAFRSESSNLVAGDTNSRWDIFVHDRQTGQTTRVSVATGGEQGIHDSYAPSISADARFVAFQSSASNLVAGDTNNTADIFVHDRQTGQTTRVSVATGGGQGNGNSGGPSISADGRFVAYMSYAANLVAGDTNNTADVFVHDRQTGQATRVSVATGGGQGNFWGDWPSISADGRFVAFMFLGSNLVAGDTNFSFDVFVHDRQTGQTTRVSVATGGGQGNSESTRPSVSADGRIVAFTSWASNLVAGDTNGYPDVFVREREPGTTYTQPNCQPLTINTGVKKVIFITHGCCTNTNEFNTIWVPLKTSVESWINSNVPNPAQWQVIAYNWTADSGYTSALNKAFDHGQCQGDLLARAAVDRSLEHIHFISHSAGSRLIAEAAKRVKDRRGSATRVHCSFLDAYAGLSMQHASSYGLGTDWSDHYRAWDFVTDPYTFLNLRNAHNVDVTRLDPCVVLSGETYLSDHGWPREFYRWTLTGATPELTCTGMPMPAFSCAMGYGWPLSATWYAGQSQAWPFATLNSQYPLNNSPAVSLSCAGRPAPERGAPPELVMATRLDEPLDLSAWTPLTSAGGVQFVPGGFEIEAAPGASYGPEGNTAWVYASIAVDEPVNFVRYDAQFMSPAAAEGLLSVYVGEEKLSGDERFSLPGAGAEEFIFELPEEVAGNTFILGFRLDAFGTGLSRAVVSNIRTGFGGFLPGPFALLSPGDGAVVQTFTPSLQWEVSAEARTYTVRISPDAAFETVIYQQSGMVGESVVLPAMALRAQTTYHWEVVSTNPLGEETAQPGSYALTTPPACGDANGDTLVDFADVTKVLENWSATYAGSGFGDANRDGMVNFSDITKVLENWATTCP